jgi:methyl-accepting chemotaxis protein
MFSVRLSNLRIGARLGIAFAAMCVLIAAVGAAGALSMRSLKSDVDVITTVNNAENELVVTMIKQVHIANCVMRTMVILDDLDLQQREQAKVVKADDSYQSAWTALQALAPSPARATTPATARCAWPAET